MHGQCLPVCHLCAFLLLVVAAAAVKMAAVVAEADKSSITQLFPFHLTRHFLSQ
jgi:hypothetical protein